MQLILQTRIGLPAPGNPSGISMKMSSFISPLRKAVIMSIYHRGQLYCAANANITRMVDHFTTGAKTSV